MDIYMEYARIRDDCSYDHLFDSDDNAYEKYQAKKSNFSDFLMPWNNMGNFI
jgi:hypothetical protein